MNKSHLWASACLQVRWMIHALITNQGLHSQIIHHNCATHRPQRPFTLLAIKSVLMPESPVYPLIFSPPCSQSGPARPLDWIPSPRLAQKAQPQEIITAFTLQHRCQGFDVDPKTKNRSKYSRKHKGCAPRLCLLYKK